MTATRLLPISLSHFFFFSFTCACVLAELRERRNLEEKGKKRRGLKGMGGSSEKNADADSSGEEKGENM